MTKRTIKGRVKIPDEITEALQDIGKDLDFERGPEAGVKAQKFLRVILDKLSSKKYGFKKKDLAELISRRTGVTITPTHLNDNVSADKPNYEYQALMVLASLGFGVVVNTKVTYPRKEEE